MLSTPQPARKQSRTFANGVCYHTRMDEKNIYRAAKLLMDQYGADAATHAAIRADAMLGAGDMERQAVWKRIVRAIKELQAAGPGTVH